ncbi:CoA transferase [Acinetobacter sp. ANC 3903]|uniref:CaiB/BaiF CoA transferase family protein n=1 Tax=Acinetobacter sp. ANC 3903 TaxID=1977883 RepID=UPI000A33902F|nr:CoA transferase [Acinetobacter sp. ANC 3903]OTG58047.1 CoA transferase [Acinetobacter sp. ANC 3903]
MQNNNQGSLKGLRILDLTHALAGPFCSQMLADHGADVIKVEPLEGDFFRKMGPFRPDDKDRFFGGLFQSCNRNKRSISLNLKTELGREALIELVKNADGLVENYRAGVLEKMGLGYEQLKEINPRLVYTSIRGFGDRVGGESPYKNWPAFDIVAQAMGGWMGVTGQDEQHPVKVGGGAGDTVSGLFAAFGTVSALLHAKNTGLGQYVDVAMTDSILALSEIVVSQFSYLGVSAKPVGNGIPGLAPFGTIKVKDGVIAIAAPHDPQFHLLCDLLGCPELKDEPKYLNEGTRWANHLELNATIEKYTVQKTKLELKELFGGRVPFSPIYTGEEIFKDEHFAARNMLPLVDHPGTATPTAVPGIPVKMSLTPGEVRTRAPKLGEHTREILNEMGWDNQRIEQLLENGILYAA